MDYHKKDDLTHDATLLGSKKGVSSIKIKMKKKPKLCVQCHIPMLKIYGNGVWGAPLCEKLDCPNYGLLQVGIEQNGRSGSIDYKL